MNIRSIVIALLFFIPSLTFAGEITGTIKKDGQPLANQEINITKDGKVVATTTTDKNGYFSTTIQQVGRFKLEMKGYEGATFDVVSTNTSISYTLALVKVEGVWQIKKQ